MYTLHVLSTSWRSYPTFSGWRGPGTKGCTSSPRILQVLSPALCTLTCVKRKVKQTCSRHACHQQTVRANALKVAHCRPFSKLCHNTRPPFTLLFCRYLSIGTMHMPASVRHLHAVPCCANLKVPQVRLSGSYPASTHPPAILNRAGGDHPSANHSPAIFRRVASVILIVPHPNFGHYSLFFFLDLVFCSPSLLSHPYICPLLSFRPSIATLFFSLLLFCLILLALCTLHSSDCSLLREARSSTNLRPAARRTVGGVGRSISLDPASRIVTLCWTFCTLAFWFLCPFSASD